MRDDELDETEALAFLGEMSDAIVAGVDVVLPAWTEAQVARVLDAWGGADAETRRVATRAAVDAGAAVAARVGDELRVLFMLDPAEMRSTPLEIVRSAVREPTAVLQTAGVPPVVRDDFDERAWPDDRYGLVPHTLVDLAATAAPGQDLTPLLQGWGLAKARVLRGRTRHAG